jgi:hypothetical protein
MYYLRSDIICLFDVNTPLYFAASISFLKQNKKEMKEKK